MGFAAVWHLERSGALSTTSRLPIARAAPLGAARVRQDVEPRSPVPAQSSHNWRARRAVALPGQASADVDQTVTPPGSTRQFDHAREGEPQRNVVAVGSQSASLLRSGGVYGRAKRHAHRARLSRNPTDHPPVRVTSEPRSAPFSSTASTTVSVKRDQGPPLLRG